MEFKYQQALETYELKISDLPKAAQIGIKEIGKIMKTIKMLEAKERSIKPETLEKVETLDKWVYYEILDHMSDDDIDNPVEKPDVEEIIDEVEESEPTESTHSEETTESEPTEQLSENNDDVDPLGLSIESELEQLHEQGVTEITMDDLKSRCPKTYSTIFEIYEADSENGVSTSRFTLIETDPASKTFVLKKQ